MFEKHKHPSLEAGLLIILVVIAIFSIGYYTESPTGMLSKEVTGNMVKITGMETIPVKTSDDRTFYVDNAKQEVYTDLQGQNKLEGYRWDPIGSKIVYTSGQTTTTYSVTIVSGSSTSPNVPQQQPAQPTTTTYYVQDKVGGAYLKIDAPNPTEANNIAIEKYGITPGTITTESKTTGTRYVVTFQDGTTYPIVANSQNNAETKGQALATQFEKQYKSVSQPKYRVYLSDTVYKEVEASSIDEAIKNVKEEYAKQNVVINPIKTEEVTSELATTDATKDYKTFVITPKDKAPFTVKAKDQSAAQTLADTLVTGEKTVEEQKYKITYGEKSYVVAESDKNKEISALSTLGISYTLKPVTGPEAAQQGELKTYRITLADGTTVNKMFVNDDAAQQFVNSLKGTKLLGENPPAPIRVITVEEASKVGYRESGFYLQDGKTPLFTKDGIKFYQDPTVASPTPYSNTLSLYKSYEIGEKIKVTEQYAIQEKATPKFNYAEIQGITTKIYDKTTLSEIKLSIGSKGTINEEGGLILVKHDAQPFQAFEISYDQNAKIEFKAILSYKNAYQKEDKVISENEYNSLTDEQKAEYTQIHMVASLKGERQLYGKQITLIGEAKIQDGKIIYQAQEFDKDGNVVYFHYREGWTYENGGTSLILDKDGNPVNAFGDKITEDQLTEAQKKLLPEARNSQTQAASRKWFSNFEFKLVQFKGLAGWSQLIFDKETLAEWREGVDKLFSSLYLGTDYWSSAICSKYIPKQQKGLFTMKTKDGLFDIVAHVEGERTSIPKLDGTKQHIYKLTFSVRNPKYSSYDKLQFNVYLYGQKTVKLYEQDISVDDGKSFTRGTGENVNGQITYNQEHGKPIVQYSDLLYDRICIKFAYPITTAEGSREDEVCNSIVEYQGSPTKYQQRVTATTQGTPGAPGEPYQEADF